MRVRQKLFPCMAALSHANDPAAAGVLAFLEVAGGVTDFGNIDTACDVLSFHQGEYHVGIGSTTCHLVAANAVVDQSRFYPWHPFQQDIRNVT